MTRRRRRARPSGPVERSRIQPLEQVERHPLEHLFEFTLHGVLAVIIGMWLFYWFVRVELGHPFYGLLAMIAWGVTTTFYENVTWYSASFFTLGLDVTLVALLAAQRFERSRHWSALALCAACSALAPAFHSTALLAHR